MFLSWASQVTHAYLPLNPVWSDSKFLNFTVDREFRQPTNHYLNGLRETDDLVKEIIFGFRDRGMENDTLFVMCATTLN
jgi:glucan phosphoethanolaminetransferase (alkaline phosphatase superfamily)